LLQIILEATIFLCNYFIFMDFKSAKLSITSMLEAGVHFGHKANNWNPLMKPYIYGERGGIHIIDVRQTLVLMQKAMDLLADVAKRGERILFVGTKMAAAHYLEEAAEKTGQYHVSKRWLGGMLTNWRTIRKSIKEIDALEEALQSDMYTKKEKISMDRDLQKKLFALSGVRKMGGLPRVLFVVDVKREEKAIKEAKKLGITVIGIVDTDSNPLGIDYPIPGNDDNAASYYIDVASDAILMGLEAAVKSVTEKSGLPSADAEFEQQLKEQMTEAAKA
jgi:small subunit ribosomal protein S2